jgi:hypothetical protein
MTLSNTELIRRLVYQHETSGHSANMSLCTLTRHSYPALMSWETPIAVMLDEGKIAFNQNKYSQSTGRQQSHFRGVLDDAFYTVTDDIWFVPYPMGMIRDEDDHPFTVYVKGEAPELSPEDYTTITERLRHYRDLLETVGESTVWREKIARYERMLKREERVWTYI